MKLVLDAGGVIVYPAFGHWRYGAAMLRPPVADTLESEAYLRAHWQPGDLVLTMGCGNINLLNEQMQQHGDTKK